MKIDTRQLRRDMEDYYGTAGFSGMSPAFMDLFEVQRADDYELCRLAQRNGFDLNRYVIDDQDDRWF